MANPPNLANGSESTPLTPLALDADTLDDNALGVTASQSSHPSSFTQVEPTASKNLGLAMAASRLACNIWGYNTQLRLDT